MTVPRYGLTPTTAPLWSASNADDWRCDYVNEPVRLSITARSKDSEWIVLAKSVDDRLIDELVGRVLARMRPSPV
ncbi:hypothetical protein ACWD4K_34275 [Streptomyces gelaticus]